MSAEAINQLIGQFAEALAPRVAKLLKDDTASNPNELLTVPQLAKEMKLGHTKVRLLISAGTLRRAPDIAEMRVSRRELERYTTGAAK